ncbi:hypothetical protein NLJ89_g7061 [Agrocybe chaxingu]|uniref:HMG box domain-containing protein n=1 Tax=Agrocybe chaxingu TaxID=84603 RepID=A0A9W8K4B1_9AGAR|nr:hypothetical protein NLJ89_g7061 [Agrocybe chaxingu]
MGLLTSTTTGDILTGGLSKAIANLALTVTLDLAQHALEDYVFRHVYGTPLVNKSPALVSIAYIHEQYRQHHLAGDVLVEKLSSNATLVLPASTTVPLLASETEPRFRDVDSRLGKVALCIMACTILAAGTTVCVLNGADGGASNVPRSAMTSSNSCDGNNSGASPSSNMPSGSGSGSQNADDGRSSNAPAPGDGGEQPPEQEADEANNSHQRRFGMVNDWLPRLCDLDWRAILGPCLELLIVVPALAWLLQRYMAHKARRRSPDLEKRTPPPHTPRQSDVTRRSAEDVVGKDHPQAPRILGPTSNKDDPPSSATSNQAYPFDTLGASAARINSQGNLHTAPSGDEGHPGPTPYATMPICKNALTWTPARAASVPVASAQPLASVNTNIVQFAPSTMAATVALSLVPGPTPSPTTTTMKMKMKTKLKTVLGLQGTDRLKAMAYFIVCGSVMVSFVLSVLLSLLYHFAGYQRPYAPQPVSATDDGVPVIQAGMGANSRDEDDDEEQEQDVEADEESQDGSEDSISFKISDDEEDSGNADISGHGDSVNQSSNGDDATFYDAPDGSDWSTHTNSDLFPDSEDCRVLSKELSHFQFSLSLEAHSSDSEEDVDVGNTIRLILVFLLSLTMLQRKPSRDVREPLRLSAALFAYTNNCTIYYIINTDSIGADITAPDLSSPIHLLPGVYTSTTNPQLLHDALTSSSSSLKSSSGFTNSSSISLPLNLVLEPGLSIYSGSLYSGQSAFQPLPNQPIVNASTPLTAKSLAVSSNVWIALNSGSANNRVIVWDAIPDAALRRESAPQPGLANAQLGSQVSHASPVLLVSLVPNARHARRTAKLAMRASPEQAVVSCLKLPTRPPPATARTASVAPTVNALATLVSPLATTVPYAPSALRVSSLHQAEIAKFAKLDAPNVQMGLANARAASLDSRSTPMTERSATPSNKRPPQARSALKEVSPAPRLVLPAPQYANRVDLIADNNKRECDTCGAKCTKCKIPNFTVASTVDQKQCTECLPGFFLNNGACVETCPSGTTVSSQDNKTCIHPLMALGCAFIFFRSWYITEGASGNEGQQNELSKHAGKVWNRMSEEDKRPFVELAIREKREHTERYPDYVYAPGGCKGSAKAKARAANARRAAASASRRKTAVAPPKTWEKEDTPRNRRPKKATYPFLARLATPMPSVALTPKQVVKSVSPPPGSPERDDFVPTDEIPVLVLNPPEEEVKVYRREVPIQSAAEPKYDAQEPQFDITIRPFHYDCPGVQFAGFKPYANPAKLHSYLPTMTSTASSPSSSSTSVNGAPLASLPTPVAITPPSLVSPDLRCPSPLPSPLFFLRPRSATAQAQPSMTQQFYELANDQNHDFGDVQMDFESSSEGEEEWAYPTDAPTCTPRAYTGPTARDMWEAEQAQLREMEEMYVDFDAVAVVT